MYARECLACDVKWIGSETDPCWMCASAGRTILGIYGKPVDHVQLSRLDVYED